jgi:hypothetical protein
VAPDQRRTMHSGNRIIDGAKALAKFPENSGSEHAASIT